MMGIDHWLLPEGIDELLPPEAWRLERLRRALLDLYRVWGYELILPPLVEFLESLRVGTGNDLDIQTFKLIDQRSGRMLGVRADITPQAARIDAHRIKHDTPTRLCYISTVLHARGDAFGGSRSPVQVGAELYGHQGIESDLEILTLMLETLHLAGLDDVHIDLGHVAIFRSLIVQAGLNGEQEAELFEILQRKALPELRAVLAEYGLSAAMREMLLALAGLNGDAEILSEARHMLANAAPDVFQALTSLEQLSQALHQRWPTLPINFDLAELRGYRYHNGVVFAAFVPGYGQEIARGGRYDQIGQAFGRARAATGFSADLKTLLSLTVDHHFEPDVIYAPLNRDPALQTQIAELRTAGARVVQALTASDEDPRALGCNRILMQQGRRWTVAPL